MATLVIDQLINGKWNHLGDVHATTNEDVCNYINVCEKYTDPNVNMNFRQTPMTMFMTNIKHGPIRFRIMD